MWFGGQSAQSTWDGSRAVLQWEERSTGQLKAVAVHSWVSLKGLEPESFHSEFNLRLDSVPLPFEERPVWHSLSDRGQGEEEAGCDTAPVPGGCSRVLSSSGGCSWTCPYRGDMSVYREGTK